MSLYAKFFKTDIKKHRINLIPVPRFDILLDVWLSIHLIPSPHDTFISG